MKNDIEQVLVSRSDIATRVKALAAEVAADLNELPDDEEVLLIPILTGSIIFVADLIRYLPLKMRMHVIAASSYPGKSTTAQELTIDDTLPASLDGQHVLIVDDILDSGQTIARMRELILERSPKSVRACVMLRKQRPVAMETPCEYVGFDIPDAFVVGYGLDYDHYYRNLPDIVTLKREAL